jgi:hypothetical protein
MSVGRGKKQPQRAISSSHNTKLAALCLNGNCLWKVKSAYDDIDEEVQDSRQAGVRERS